MSVASKPPLALIAGPTASGKSALALELARRSGGVILNADSAQLYRDLPILSAAPTAADRAAADHLLYGEWDGAVPCSAADWASRAKEEITAIQAEGRLPIVVGGTGLYLRTLLDGIAPIPAIAPDVRSQIRARDVGTNFEALARLDPEAAARLAPGDTTRIARALEVVMSTGRPLSAWQAHREGGIGADVDVRPVVLLPPREWLYERCNRRFAEMVKGGAIEEVARLLARGLDPALPVMRAIGVPEIAVLLRGEVDTAAMIASGQQATRRYAKRQYTWFAHQPPADWPRLTAPLDTVMAEALALLGQPS